MRGGSRADKGVLEDYSPSQVLRDFNKKELELIFFDRVPFIVALNKIDKVGSNVEAVAEQLRQEGVLLEDLGGEVNTIFDNLTFDCKC